MTTAVTSSTKNWSKGYEFALSLVLLKCHEGLTDEDRKAVADWRENIGRTRNEQD